MNIEDVHFGRSEMFFDVQVKMIFVLTPTVQYKIWTLSIRRCSTIELFPSSGTHKRFAHFPSECNWSKVFFRGLNMSF